jgi:hypothetical protein
MGQITCGHQSYQISLSDVSHLGTVVFERTIDSLELVIIKPAAVGNLSHALITALLISDLYGSHDVSYVRAMFN